MMKKMSATPAPPPRPPPAPLPRLGLRSTARVTKSITNQQIERFWKRKRAEQEEHFLAAIKAAARIRARNLTENDYKCFEESLNDHDAKEVGGFTEGNNDETDKELRVGIKDWWTKSKYAYLNQPAIGSQDASRKRHWTYVPNSCFYNPTPLYPTSFGIL